MARIGITAYGAYIPSLRLQRKAIAEAHAWAIPSLKGLSKGARAFCSWDETSITMAVEALRSCMKTSPEPGSSLTFISTTPVYADLQNAATVAAAAGLPEELTVMDSGGSLRAGTSALIVALRSHSEGTAYLVASDCRDAKPGSSQEMLYGAGSAALAIGAEGVIAEALGYQSITTQFIDHYRAADAPYDYYWEDRWVRDEGYLKIVPRTVAALLDKTSTKAADIDYFCMPGIMPRIAESVAKCVGIGSAAVVENFAQTVGDTGSPQPLLMLMAALQQARPGEKILVVGFGAGCDAILFQATEAITAYRPAAAVSDAIAAGREVSHYGQLLAFNGRLELDWGMRAETDNKTSLSQLYRAQEQITGFNGGECRQCGAVQFPVLAACVKCGSTAAMMLRPLADEPAKVATFTADHLQYYPAPPMYWGLVQFANGARMLMEMVEVDPATLEVGTPLRMVYRIKQKDAKRGLDRYFWKAAQC